MSAAAGLMHSAVHMWRALYSHHPATVQLLYCLPMPKQRYTLNAQTLYSPPSHPVATSTLQSSLGKYQRLLQMPRTSAATALAITRGTAAT